MNSIITKEYIVELVKSEWERALKLTNYKTAIYLKEINVIKMRPLGSAYFHGRIDINEQFVGTNNHVDLLDTIRHEICHLLVGISEMHGKVWKRMCCHIGCKPRAKTSVNGDLREKLNKEYISDSKYIVYYRTKSHDKLFYKSYKKYPGTFLRKASGKKYRDVSSNESIIEFWVESN